MRAILAAAFATAAVTIALPGWARPAAAAAKPPAPAASAPAAPETPFAIMTGKPSGTYVRFGEDIARVAARFGLGFAAETSAGSLENVDACLRRKRTPLCIVQGDVLDFVASFADDAELRATASAMRMVFPLYAEEVHLLARPGIERLADLNGRQVAVGAPNSGTLLTATLLLASADVTPKAEARIDTEEALESLRAGQIDAMFYVAGRPAKLFQKVTPEDGLHLVRLDDPALRGLYEAASIPAGTYRWQREEIATVAVRAVLMTYDYAKPNAYHRQACAAVGKAARMVKDNLAWLKGEGRGHPKWAEVDLDATAPVKWERSRCALDGLNGAQAYVIPPEPAAAGGAMDCAAEDNPIRRRLCEVRRTMRAAPTAHLAPASPDPETALAAVALGR